MTTTAADASADVADAAPPVADVAQPDLAADAIVPAAEEPAADAPQAASAPEPATEPNPAESNEPPTTKRLGSPSGTEGGDPETAAPPMPETEIANGAAAETPAVPELSASDAAEPRLDASAYGTGERWGDDGEPEQDDEEESLSAQFFRGNDDSVPPVEADTEEPRRPVVALTPAMLARRAQLRRVVAGIVAFVGALSIAGLTRHAVVTHRGRLAEAKPAVAAAAVAPKRVEHPVDVAPPPPAAPPPVAEAPKPASQPEATSEAATHEASTSEPPDAAAIKTLKREAERLYGAGKNQEAIAKAQEVIAADPTDALPYLIAGSALQNSGKWKEGIAFYSDCVKHAKKGPITECYAMGGHK